MNLPLITWGVFACGAGMLVISHHWQRTPWGWFTAVIVWLALVFTLSQHVEPWLRIATVLALAWSVGFIASAAQNSAAWGRTWLIVAALMAIGSGQDWLTLGVAFEVVRRATARHPFTLGPSLGLWTAIVIWLFVCGSLGLDEIANVLQHSYAARSPEVSIGRPSLLVAAAVCLTILSLVVPCIATERDNQEIWAVSLRRTELADICARQIAAMLLLLRCGRDVFVGVEAPAIWVLLVVTGGVWLIAIRTVAQPSRLDRLWIGCSYWQLAIALTWLVVVMLERTSIPGGFPRTTGLRFPAACLVAELIHGLICLAAMPASAQLLINNGNEPHYLEELRGAAHEHPMWAVMFLVPIASLIGLPLVWGSWLRGLLLVSAWTLPQAGPNDTLSPHAGLLTIELVGLAAWVLLAGSVLTTFRTIAWDHLLTSWSTRRNPWLWLIAIATSAALIVGGIAPQFWVDWLIKG